ncbi:hypothetical protein Bca52824_093229 [Brassica carinata]|uniref:Uncharacterized protein n=1 Tax=Brassica carinata TaxID=52824 RepID=A0A8X7P7W7_BRACI|nr:hypothetical protein Bca52824_093229 [Brassica carinata]
MEDSGIVGRLARVSRPVVRRFVQSVSDQAVGMGVIRGVKPDQQLVKGISCMVIAGDVYRPAAIDQLWRLQIDKGMMNELKDVKKVLNPTEVLLTGQEAAEEREKPELLAESLERRKRVAEDSGKTETGEPTCGTNIPNESEDEELDGSNGRRIHSCFKRARGRNESRTKGFLFTFHVYGEDDEQNRAGGSVPSPHDRRQNSEEENEYAAQVTEQPDASVRLNFIYLKLKRRIKPNATFQFSNAMGSNVLQSIICAGEPERRQRRLGNRGKRNLLDNLKRSRRSNGKVTNALRVNNTTQTMLKHMETLSPHSLYNLSTIS